MSDANDEARQPTTDVTRGRQGAPRGKGGRGGPGGAGPDGMYPTRPAGCSSWLLLMLGLFLLNYLIVNLFFPGPSAPVEIPYTVFRQQAEAGNVESVATRADTVQGLFREPVTLPMPDVEGLEAMEPVSI